MIFICPFNIFDEYGYHIYTFQARAKENTNIILEDGTSKVFVCAKGCSDDVSENMKLFLDYLSGELSDNNLVRKLDDAVKFARKSKEWRAEYMLTQQDKLIMQHEYEALLSEKDEALAEKNEALAEKDKAIAEKNAEIARLKALLDKKE